MALSRFIVYACPEGLLGEQIEAFYQRSLEVCGENAAHSYMPHCTLIGFFEDDKATIPLYLKTLNMVYSTAKAIGFPLKIKVGNLTFKPNWYGLELEEQGIKNLMTSFLKQAKSPSRSEELRLKTWLHVSLAYEFTDGQSNALKQLAQNMVNPNASAKWFLRFYEKHADGSWTCHQSWPLNS